MKKQGIFGTAFIFSIILIQRSFPSLNSSIEHEYPQAPCPSLSSSFACRPTSCSTESASIATIPHGVSWHNPSPLDAQNLSTNLSTLDEEYSPLKVKITQISDHRWYISCKPSEVSENWREDSFVEENGNAQNVALLPSKNELAFQKSYLAAALRAMHKQSSYSPSLSSNPKLAKGIQKHISYSNDLLEEHDAISTVKDCRSASSMHITISKREDRSSSNETFWQKHQDPAFWE